LIVTRIGVDIQRYPAVFAHLSQWQTALEKRFDQGSHWWELRACAYYDAFEMPKILYPDIAMISRFTFDTESTYFGNTVYMIALDDQYLLGVLNSSTIWWLVRQQFACLGDPNNGGRFRFFTQSVETLPIPTPPADLRDRIAAAARACLDAAKDHSDRLPALEAELNALVYQAYGLDSDDIAVIEGAVGGRGSTNENSTNADDEDASL